MAYLCNKFTVLPCLKLLPVLATGTLCLLPATVNSVCQDSVHFGVVDLTL